MFLFNACGCEKYCTMCSNCCCGCLEKVGECLGTFCTLLGNCCSNCFDGINNCCCGNIKKCCCSNIETAKGI